MTRTRFAPSPTGYMHIGNLRSALFTYLLAKKDNGTFILRIEDTDQTRKVDGAVEFIIDCLNLCNLTPDEGAEIGGQYGPYYQSERLDLYRKYALELVEKNEAYYCFCDECRLNDLREKSEMRKTAFMYDGHCKKLTKEQIEEKLANNEAYVIRQRIPREGFTSYEDIVYGNISVENKLLEDQILLKSDSYPTYNFANVIDDHLMDITHVVRGNEYLSSTPKYLLLYKSFGWQSPKYVHLPWVVKADGTKISKRNKDDNLMDLIKRGFLTDAIVNYLALIGWSPKENKEIFTLNELAEAFDATRINTSPGAYDIKKLEWFNAHYIKKMSDEAYLIYAKAFLAEAFDIKSKEEEWINRLLLIYKNHISYAEEIGSLVGLFFEDDINPNEECIEFMKSDESILLTLEAFRDEVISIVDWNVENISTAISNVKEKTGAKGKLLFMPIRIAVSGIMHGPELADTIYLIGKNRVLKRLDK